VWGRVGIGVFIFIAVIVWIAAILFALGYPIPGLPVNSLPPPKI